MSDGMRKQLVGAGIVLLERDGVQALSVRNLAAEAGTSTMAVYTHFGGMTGVTDAIASEVFARFAQALTEVPQTDDPVADFLSMGIAYHGFAMANHQRYQLMFGTSVPAPLAGYRTDLTVTGSASGRAEWGVSFDALRNAVHRMMAAGRIRDDGELAIAGRIWSIIHGAVMLEMAGFFGHEGHGRAQIRGPLTLDVLVGMGDDRDRVNQSLTAALNTLASG
jgi:AcrR family transcriptional regulator